MITSQEAKAGLGLATKLQEMLMMPKAQTQTPNSPQEAPQTPNSAQEPQPPQNQETGTDLQTQMQGLESRIFDELGVLKQEIQKVSGQDTTKVLEDLKKQIDTALSSNE